MGILCSLFPRKNADERDDVESNKFSKKRKKNIENYQQNKNVDRSHVKRPSNPRSRSQSQEKHRNNTKEREMSGRKHTSPSLQNSNGGRHSASVTQEKKKISPHGLSNNPILPKCIYNSNQAGPSRATVVSYQIPAPQKTLIENNFNNENVQQPGLMYSEKKYSKNRNNNKSHMPIIPPTKFSQYEVSVNVKPPIYNAIACNTQVNPHYSEPKNNDHLPPAISLAVKSYIYQEQQSIEPKPSNYYQEGIVAPTKPIRTFQSSYFLQRSIEYKANTNKSQITAQSSRDSINQLSRREQVSPSKVIPRIIPNSNKTVSDVKGAESMLVIRQNLRDLKKVEIPKTSHKPIGNDKTDLDNLRELHKYSSVSSPEYQKITAALQEIVKHKPITRINTVQSTNQFNGITQGLCEPVVSSTPRKTHRDFTNARNLVADVRYTNNTKGENAHRSQKPNILNDNPPFIDQPISVPEPELSLNKNTVTSNEDIFFNSSQSPAINKNLLKAQKPNYSNTRPHSTNLSHNIDLDHKPNSDLTDDTANLGKAKQKQPLVQKSQNHIRQIIAIQSLLIKKNDTSLLNDIKENSEQISNFVNNQSKGNSYINASCSENNMSSDKNGKSSISKRKNKDISERSLETNAMANSTTYSESTTKGALTSKFTLTSNDNNNTQRHSTTNSNTKISYFYPKYDLQNSQSSGNDRNFKAEVENPEDIIEEGAKLEGNNTILIKGYCSYDSPIYASTSTIEHNKYCESMTLETDNLVAEKTDKQNVTNQIRGYYANTPFGTNPHVDNKNDSLLSGQNIFGEEVPNENHPNDIPTEKLKLYPTASDTSVKDSINNELKEIELQDDNIAIDTSREKTDEEKYLIHQPLESEHEQIEAQAQDYVNLQFLEQVQSFLRQILEEAMSFERKIEMFTELEDSNRYYYIEESLRRLIDKLDDMFDDIGQKTVLRNKRKQVYRYIFPLFDRLDDKVAENKERIKREEEESPQIALDYFKSMQEISE